MAAIHSKVIIILFFVDCLLGFVRNLGFVIYLFVSSLVMQTHSQGSERWLLYLIVFLLKCVYNFWLCSDISSTWCHVL